MAKCIHGYPWTVHGTPCREMAGKVTREYIVSMDPSFHGLSAHPGRPMGELLIPWVSVLPDLWI